MKNTNNPRNSPDQAQTASEHGHITNQTMNLGGPTLLMVLALTIVIGACGVVIGIDIAERSQMERQFLDLQRQYRMTELKLDDWTVVAHRSGLVLPGDYARGPQGNLDTESFTQEKDHGSRRSHPAKLGGQSDRQ